MTGRPDGATPYRLTVELVDPAGVRRGALVGYADDRATIAELVDALGIIGGHVTVTEAPAPGTTPPAPGRFDLPSFRRCMNGDPDPVEAVDTPAPPAHDTFLSGQELADLL